MICAILGNNVSSEAFLFNQIVIRTLFIILLILIWTLLLTVRVGGKITEGEYLDQFVVAHNSPKIGSYGAFNPCSCIDYAKAITGHVGEVWGNARDLKPNSLIPWVGSLVLLNEGPYGHVAVITKITGSELHIAEANYTPCKVSERVISINYEAIRGFVELSTF